MIVTTITFYVIGILILWVLGEIRSNLSLILQRLEWINRDIKEKEQ